VIDFVSVDDANNVNLVISDHLDWSATKEHPLLLQEKLNTYCKYVENGQRYDECPRTRDRRTMINIVFFQRSVAEGEQFLQRVTSVLEQEGFSLCWAVNQDGGDR
jgi:hypothetical protein